ncbi:MAG: NAD-dependent epimerase/dehydratase family protein, partial [Deltaproteobacteria bacterium]|nr:NAD-dependent epimerase/dehydratase family protein [Deltaproteobacteria bacterium]
FLGSNLVRGLCGLGFHVTALARKDLCHPILNGLEFDTVKGDILDSESLAKGIKGCEYVFHCAAKVSFNRYEIDELTRVNVEGTRRVLKASAEAGVKRVVHVSACAVFGYSNDPSRVLDEDTKYDVPPESVYAYTKKLAEDEVRKAAIAGLDTVIANPCTVYGRGDRSLNSGILIKSVFDGKIKVAPPGGTSFVSVRDVVNGLVLLMDRGRSGEGYIFCAENLDYLELINQIAAALGSRKVGRRLPRSFYYPVAAGAKLFEGASNLFRIRFKLLTAQIVKETFGYKYFSPAKAIRELGWRPEQGLGDCVREAFEFYRTEGLV